MRQDSETNIIVLNSALISVNTEVFCIRRHRPAHRPCFDTEQRRTRDTSRFTE